MKKLALIIAFVFFSCEQNDGVDICGKLVDQYQRYWDNKDNMTQEQIDSLRKETKKRFKEAGCDVTPLEKYL